jgi:hypothetical protein
VSEERSLPPVTQLGMLSLSLIGAAVIDLAAHLPKHVSLAPAIALLATSAAVLVGNVVSLWRTDGFAWSRFLEVARWALLAYAVIAGLIEYVFLRNNTSGGPLIVLTLSLVVFALNVPVLIAFTVARYDDPESADEVRPAG